MVILIISKPQFVLLLPFIKQPLVVLIKKLNFIITVNLQSFIKQPLFFSSVTAKQDSQKELTFGDDRGQVRTIELIIHGPVNHYKMVANDFVCKIHELYTEYRSILFRLRKGFA